MIIVLEPIVIVLENTVTVLLLFKETIFEEKRRTPEYKNLVI